MGCSAGAVRDELPSTEWTTRRVAVACRAPAVGDTADGMSGTTAATSPAGRSPPCCRWPARLRLLPRPRPQRLTPGTGTSQTPVHRTDRRRSVRSPPGLRGLRPGLGTGSPGHVSPPDRGRQHHDTPAAHPRTGDPLPLSPERPGRDGPAGHDSRTLTARLAHPQTPTRARSGPDSRTPTPRLAHRQTPTRARSGPDSRGGVPIAASRGPGVHESGSRGAGGQRRVDPRSWATRTV
jgi:hypothetical protein